MARKKLTKHLRRADPMPRGQFYYFGCDCGWEGKVPIHRRGRRLDHEQLRQAAEKLWVSHIPPRDRRLYLLYDTRAPASFQSMDELLERERDEGRDTENQLVRLRVAAEFQQQPQIVGNFLMPEGLAVDVIRTEMRDGVYWGTFTLDGGAEQELPVGEIRTPEGRVFRPE